MGRCPWCLENEKMIRYHDDGHGWSDPLPKKDRGGHPQCAVFPENAGRIWLIQRVHLGLHRGKDISLYGPSCC